MPPKSSKRKASLSAPGSSPPRLAKKSRTKLPDAAPPVPGPPPAAAAANQPTAEQLRAHIVELETQVALLQQQALADAASHAAEKKTLREELINKFEQKWDVEQLEFEEGLIREHNASITAHKSACKELLAKSASQLQDTRSELFLAKATGDVWESRAHEYLQDLKDARVEIDEADAELDEMNREIRFKEGEVEGTRELVRELEARVEELERTEEKMGEVRERLFEDSQRYYNRAKEVEEFGRMVEGELRFYRNRVEDLELQLRGKRGVSAIDDGEGSVVRKGPMQREDGTWQWIECTAVR